MTVRHYERALLLRYGARLPRKVAHLLRFSQANLSCPGWARWLQCERTGHAKSLSVWQRWSGDQTFYNINCTISLGKCRVSTVRSELEKLLYKNFIFEREKRLCKNLPHTLGIAGRLILKFKISIFLRIKNNCEVAFPPWKWKVFIVVIVSHDAYFLRYFGVSG